MIQDEKALYEAAKRRDVSAVRRYIAARVNVDCTPYQVLFVLWSMSLHIVVSLQYFTPCLFTEWHDSTDDSVT